MPMAMPSARDVLLRESILKALSGAPRGLDADELSRVVEGRLHSGVFPRGSEGAVPAYRDEMLARGILQLDGGLYRRAAAQDDAWILAQWFDALGGLTALDETLHRSPLPYERTHFDALRAAGVRVVYSFEDSVRGDDVRAAGLDWRPHFWVDNGRPSHDEMDAFLADLASLPAGTRAVVHCKAGLGRTGMAAACALASRHGWDAERALAHYWARVPFAREVMEHYGQANFVRRHLSRRRA